LGSTVHHRGFEPLSLRWRGKQLPCHRDKGLLLKEKLGKLLEWLAWQDSNAGHGLG